MPISSIFLLLHSSIIGIDKNTLFAHLKRRRIRLGQHTHTQQNLLTILLLGYIYAYKYILFSRSLPEV